MTAVSESDSSLATQCLDFCQALAVQGKVFKFSLTIGSTFTFSLDTKESRETLLARTKQGPRKSPSTLKRNAKRRQEFLMRKSGMESNQTPVEKDEAFQCGHCEVKFKTRNGLKIHVGKNTQGSCQIP